MATTSSPVSDEVSAAVLARAVGDAISPARPSGTAHLGNALLYPTMLRAIALLADAGYQLVKVDRADSLDCHCVGPDQAPGCTHGLHIVA